MRVRGGRWRHIYERKLRLWWRRKTDTKEAVEIDRV